MTATPGDREPHRLDPLLRPASIAYVGASRREGSFGNVMVRLAAHGGYAGAVYPINPGYEEVEGYACYPDLRSLPETPDLAVIAVADTRLEGVLTDVAAAGVRAALIFGGANLVEEDAPRPLAARLRAIALEADLPICGGNCMGFYNLDHGLLATFVKPPYETRPGGMTLISHSGSSWSALTLNDGRLAYNLAVSAGQELTVTVADYLDYAVRQDNTTAVGLVLETIRDPESFIAALEAANRRAVPVVALKVGRSERGARLAISHSGAIAGDDAAYEAVFDRYGVSRADTLEELASGLLLLGQPRPVGPGGLAAILDSGFERELFVDLAEDRAVPFAAIGDVTTTRLAEVLDPGLEPVNPVDAWGTGHDYENVFIESFDALLGDPDTAIGVIAHSARDGAWVTQAWVASARSGIERHPKPVALVTNFPWTRHAETLAEAVEAGIPVIEGMGNGLRAVAICFEQRDFRDRAAMTAPAFPGTGVRERWRHRLESGPAPGEAETLALLADYGVGAAPAGAADGLDEALALFRTLDGPVALKTAAPAIAHKSDADGVRLNLGSEREVGEAYRDLAARLGPRVTVMRMAEPGVEMSLGITHDAQFGSLVMIGAGGVLIELLRDRRLALPPFDRAHARRLIESLRTRALLDGYRGQPPADVDAFAAAAAGLSALAADLGDLIAELDVNPIIVNASGAVAVDALLVVRETASVIG